MRLTNMVYPFINSLIFVRPLQKSSGAHPIIIQEFGPENVLYFGNGWGYINIILLSFRQQTYNSECYLAPRPQFVDIPNPILLQFSKRPKHSRRLILHRADLLPGLIVGQHEMNRHHWFLPIGQPRNDRERPEQNLIEIKEIK
jgi:hypothetical protein